MKDKTKNSYDNKRGNSLKTDFSKNLNQLIEDQSKKISNPFQGLSEKMIISTSRDDKQIFLWDERTGGIVFSYEDESIKTYIPRTKINVLGVYSDYIIATQENKSMFLVWKTDTVDAIFKSSPIEERITVFKPSSDSLYFFIGTESGKVYIYELFSGNILTSFQAHLETINDLEINYDRSVLITCSHDNLLRVFLIESIMDNHASRSTNVQPFSELLVGSKELLSIKFCGIPTYLIFGVTKDNTIIVFEYPKLSVLRKIYFNDTISSFEFNNAFSDVFIHQNRRIYYIKVEEIFNKQDQSSISQDTLKRVIESEKLITCFNIGNKYFLAGQEDGIIALYDLNTFKFVQNVSIHKGPVTNILCVNRPISQYGLSYNNTVSTQIIKQLKKSNTGYQSNTSVSSSSINSNFIEEFMEEVLEKQENNLSFLNIQEEIRSSNKSITNSDEKSMFDEKFLQRKLAEAYLLLKNN